MNKLFVYFTGETELGEQIYFAVSEDGLYWRDLHGGKPILISDIGEKGVRDPFIIRSVIDHKVYLIATDLRIASGKGWDVARTSGSKALIIWNSYDLVHWSDPWQYEVKNRDVGCVWAPEAIYDPKRDAYLVFWASLYKEKDEENSRHRIFSSYTKDFQLFSEAKIYIERSNHIIDTTIIEENGVFYRFSKEAAIDGISMEYGTDLQGEFTKIESDCLNELTGVEGPLIFQLKAENTWCLMVDQFAKKAGYLPLASSNLRQGRFNEIPTSQYDLGGNTKRHGSVLQITQDEYEKLIEAYGESL